jgi:hypothetical protein
MAISKNKTYKSVGFGTFFYSTKILYMSWTRFCFVTTLLLKFVEKNPDGNGIEIFMPNT